MDWINKPLQKTQARLKKWALSARIKPLAPWMNKRKWLLALILLGIMMLKLSRNSSELVTLAGHAMGKDYRIQYRAKQGRNYQEDIDTLLAKIEQSLALHGSASALSQFNAYDCRAFHFEAPYLYPVLAKSKEVYNQTEGAFDPTVAPLVDAWEATPNEGLINALRECVSLDYIVVNEKRLKRLKEGVRLDLNGLVPGYSADAVVAFLREKGVDNLCIALGSEVVSCGKLAKNKAWQITIDIPTDPQATHAICVTTEITDRAISTSRQYKPLQGVQQHGRIIDPQAALPAQHTLLAATVLAPDGITADAFATAMMVRGVAFAQELAEKLAGIEAFLAYQDEQGKVALYASKGLAMTQSKDAQAVNLKVLS